MNFTQLLATLPPGWARDTALKRAWLQLFARALDGLLEDERQGVAARFPSLAPDDALSLLGAERSLQQFPGEYVAAWRNRVAHAFDFWDRAGTVPGMLAALEQMGYGVRIGMLDGNVADGILRQVPGGVALTQASGGPVTPSTTTVVVDGESFTLPTLIVPDDYTYYSYPPTRIIEHFREDTSIWAEFSIYLTPTDSSYNADAWDDGSRWDDGSLWDLTLTQSEIDRVRAVIGQIKPAHARLRGIYLVSRFSNDYWDDSTLWNDNSVWDADMPTRLYLRPGA